MLYHLVNARGNCHLKTDNKLTRDRLIERGYREIKDEPKEKKSRKAVKEDDGD